MPGGGTRPGEEVRDGPHNNNRCGGNRCGVAPTAAPLRPQAEAELPRFGAQALRFATTTGGRRTTIPPVAPSVAASKHTSARIETCFSGTTTDIPGPPLCALLRLSHNGPGYPLQFLLSHATIVELSEILRWSPCHVTNRLGQDILKGSPSPRALEDEWTSISRHLTTKKSHVA